MYLDESAQRLVANWQKMARAFRLAQQEHEPSHDEWRLNQAWAEALERCASELASVMATRFVEAREAKPAEHAAIIRRARKTMTIPTG